MVSSKGCSIINSGIVTASSGSHRHFRNKEVHMYHDKLNEIMFYRSAYITMNLVGMWHRDHSCDVRIQGEIEGKVE